jgi:hypothetical protein
LLHGIGDLSLPSAGSGHVVIARGACYMLTSHKHVENGEQVYEYFFSAFDIKLQA